MKKVIAVMLLVALSLTMCLAAVGCEQTCNHDYDQKGVCKICGAKNPDFKCTHNYNKYGKCTICGEDDPNFVCTNHEFNDDGVCTICGLKQHVHNYDNHGQCLNAKETYAENEQPCDMPQDPSKCTEHDYDNTTHKCKYCGVEQGHVHTLDNHGQCTGTLNDGSKCPYQDKSKCTAHEYNLYGDCTFCGTHNPDFVCNNHNYKNGKCEYCGAVEQVDKSFSDTPVTIKFYHTMGQNLRDVLDQYLADFKAMYPNITIEHSQVGNYNDVRDQIKTEIAAGNQPNLAYCYPDHVATYNTSNAVATLDSYINSVDYVVDAQGNKHSIGLSAEEIADFIPGYYAEGKQFGSSKMYTLPFSKSTEVLYYNETFFTANNIPVPTHWWCSAEICGNCNTSSMEAVCQKIKGIDSTSIPLGYDSEANWFITMCEQLGSDYTAARGENYLFNNETNRKFVERFRTWYQNGWMTTQGLYGSYTSGLFTKIAADEQKSYMSIGSSAGATHQRPSKVTLESGTDAYPFNVGIATVPQMDIENKANHKVISQGPSICMFAKEDKNEELATWLLMKYLTTNVEFQAAFSIASGYIPVLKSVMDETKAEYEDGEPANAVAIFLDELSKANGGDNIAQLSLRVAMEQADAYYTSPAFNGSSTARDQVGALMQKCFVLTGDDIPGQIKGAFDAAIQECQARN